MINKHLPTKQEFLQNPIGFLSATWVISNTLTAILIPRATVIFLTLLGLSVLVNSIVKRRFPPIPARLFVGALVSILIVAALSFFWSVAPDETLRRLPRICLLFLWGLLALAAVQQATPKIADGAMSLTVMVFAIAMIVITIEIYMNYPIYRTLIALLKQTPKPSHVNGNIVNQPALLIALYLWPVSLALWLKGFRAFSIGAIAFALLVFLPSQSESVGLALICGTLAFGLTALVPRLMKIWLSFAIIGLLIAMPMIPQLLQSLLQGHEKQIALSGLHRLEIWDFVAGKIFEHPILGYGLEASRTLAAPHSSVVIPHASILPLHPHNGFLQVWLELGIAGYAIMGFLWLWIVHKISLLKGARMAFSTGLFVCGLSLFTTAFGMWQSWVIAVEFSAAGALLLFLKLGDKSLRFQGQIDSASVNNNHEYKSLN